MVLLDDKAWLSWLLLQLLSWGLFVEGGIVTLFFSPSMMFGAYDEDEDEDDDNFSICGLSKNPGLILTFIA
jgi:hypothetical protein